MQTRIDVSNGVIGPVRRQKIGSAVCKEKVSFTPQAMIENLRVRFFPRLSLYGQTELREGRGPNQHADGERELLVITRHRPITAASLEPMTQRGRRLRA